MYWNWKQGNLTMNHETSDLIALALHCCHPQKISKFITRPNGKEWTHQNSVCSSLTHYTYPDVPHVFPCLLNPHCVGDMAYNWILCNMASTNVVATVLFTAFHFFQWSMIKNWVCQRTWHDTTEYAHHLNSCGFCPKRLSPPNEQHESHWWLSLARVTLHFTHELRTHAVLSGPRCLAYEQYPTYVITFH